jgi:hypothetical protein
LAAQLFLSASCSSFEEAAASLLGSVAWVGLCFALVDTMNRSVGTTQG